jgi:hypothetical protein
MTLVKFRSVLTCGLPVPTAGCRTCWRRRLWIASSRTGAPSEHSVTEHIALYTKCSSSCVPPWGAPASGSWQRGKRRQGVLCLASTVIHNGIISHNYHYQINTVLAENEGSTQLVPQLATGYDPEPVSSKQPVSVNCIVMLFHLFLNFPIVHIPRLFSTEAVYLQHTDLSSLS